jgi:hypothetical protein
MSDQSGQSVESSAVMDSTYRGLEEKVNWLITMMQERVEREARVSREEVIRNPRLSGGGTLSLSGTGGGGVLSPAVDSREDAFQSPNPPRHQGRFTLSPQNSNVMEENKAPADAPFSRPVPAVEDPFTAAQRRAGEERLLKKVKTPPTFSGNDAEDEISEVRDWVEVFDDFLDCVVGPGYDGDLALTFVKNNLRGPAHDWMKAKISAFEEAVANGDLPKSMRQGLKWSEVKKLLVEAFESPQYQVMKRFELQELRLGHGKHKTLPIFNAAFDKLSRRLYPIGTDFENNLILDRVLADEYSTILERSDIYLWRDVVKTGPQTLSQWKARTATVWSAREVLRSNEHRNRNMQGGAGRGNRRTQFGAGGTSVNEVDTKEDHTVTEEEEDEETPGQAPASVQRMQADKRTNSSRRPPRPPSKAHHILTEEQMKVVWDKNLCLQCYKPGHHRGDEACGEKGKPRRKPVGGELKE